MSFEWNDAINKLYNKEPEQILDDTVEVSYKVHWLGGDNGYFHFEILDKEVHWENHDKFQYYDEESVSCWESMDMKGFIKDNFNNPCAGDEISFKVRLKFSYHEDYYGESDVDWETELL